jgi:competence protein ComEC
MQQQAYTLITKQNPFLRFIYPLLLGILLEWYAKLPAILCWLLLVASILLLTYLSRCSLKTRFQFRHYSGISIYSLLFGLGMLLVFYHDQRNDPAFFSNLNKPNSIFTATLNDRPTFKGKTYKALATINQVTNNGTQEPAIGKIIIYLKAGNIASKLQYGDQLVFSKYLEAISNSNRPSSFDYKRYCALQNIYFQVRLQTNEYAILSAKGSNWFKKSIFAAQEKIVGILKKYISSEKESGLAEAMLIGYKDDLDKDLLQSYTNTGVVHVIAISGLHLALVWWILTSFCRLLGKNRAASISQLLIIIAGLWLFSLLSGASASVMRSAVMFSFLAIGNFINRKASIYNSLAASAFLLLCYDPYWLFDVGFQLSYSAVLSLAIFMNPIYNWFKIQNKILQNVWKVCSATLAAQILTLPLCIYYFHQFPLLFLIANLLVVPLSSLILLGEIFLCVIFFIQPLAKWVGIVLQGAIHWMNSFIENLNRIPFTRADGLYLNTLQAILLYISIAAFATWLMRKNNKYVIPGLSSILLIAMLRCFAIWWPTTALLF